MVDRFQQVKDILDGAVGGMASVVPGPHGAFWRDKTPDEFVAFSLFGLPVVTPGDGNGSTIVKALRGDTPFGQDVGTAGAQFRRMPAGRPPVPPDQLATIVQWIDEGCPAGEADAALGPVEALLDGAPSGEGFVVVSSADQQIPSTLRLRSTDGTEGDVDLTVQPADMGVSLSPASVRLSGQPVEVRVVATAASSFRSDTTIKVARAGQVLAELDFTAVAAPAVRFTGRFQCRLATDPDRYDDPWGTSSSIGMFSVQGPDPGSPDEPPFDRVVRFQDAVALRPFCAPIGVAVVAVEAQVGNSVERFTAGDPMIGLTVRLGPTCTFDSRNGQFAPDGFEPISDFQVEVGDVFSGASAPGVPRSGPDEPPGSTAPYADGIFQLDVDPTPWSPRAFGYPEATWAERGWAVVARKLAQLVAQQPADDREVRIRDRRLQQHAPDTIAALAFPIRLMERYRGLVDRDVVFAPAPTGALAYLALLPQVEFYAEFMDFDPDCQTGTVTGTVGPPRRRPATPAQVLEQTPFRRVAPSP